MKCSKNTCKLRLHASWFQLAGTSKFVIQTFIFEYIYIGTNHLGNWHANENWVVANVKNKLKDTPQYRAIQCNQDVIVLYLMAWHRRKKAIFELNGSYKDSFINLKVYCYQIKTINFKSYAKLEVNKDNCFLQLLVVYNGNL